MHLDNIFIFAALIAGLFFIGKLLESQLIPQPSSDADVSTYKPFKYVARDTIIVYLSVIAGGFIMQQIYPSAGVGAGAIDVFTDDPAL